MGVKKESKKSKKRAESDVDKSDDDNTSLPIDESPARKKKKSKDKKRPYSDEDDDAPSTAEKEQRKQVRAARKVAKAKEKAELLSRIPTHDADGIPYSKLQIRRMTRRVKHGLNPIATDEEEREIKQREATEKKEEEILYANEEEHVDDDQENGDIESDSDEEQNEATGMKTQQPHQPPNKKPKRTKEVPADYVCSACSNEIADFSPHWIYDCPNKVTKRGCNHVAKKLRGLHDPASRKVFVSGLPFEVTEGGVKRFFEESVATNGGEIAELVHCKLHKFEDSQRCKGTGILTFESDESAKVALKLNGSIWKDIEEPGTKTKKPKKKGSDDGEKKELRLKVTKLLNRFVTKHKK